MTTAVVRSNPNSVAMGEEDACRHELATLVERHQHRSLRDASNHYAMIPPSTVTIVPVVHAASSDARYSTACAMSSGLPSRPRGY
jgi:hypothetical protein